MADPYAAIATPQNMDPYADIATPAPDAAPRAPRPVGAAMSMNNPPLPAPGPRPAEPASPGKPWADVPGEALRNLPASAGNFLSALVHPILHPIDTANALGGIAAGVINKTGRPGDLRREWDPEPTPQEIDKRAAIEAPANAVGKFFADRYGTVEGFKNALATDPVGVAADAATVLSGGSALPGRAGSMIGTAARAIDPVTQGINALKVTGNLTGKTVEKLTSNALGATTGAGAVSVRAAGRAGREGGETAATFRQNMRGQVPVSDVVDTAKDALAQMRAERGSAYRAGMADLSKDKTVMEFAPIDTAVDKAAQVGSFKGVTVEPRAQAIVAEMRETVEQWKQLDPIEYHTPEGIDALKRTLANIRDATQFHTPERVAADRIYKAVRDEIVEQAPGYSKIMEAYQQASDKLNETTRTLSLGEKASGDTAARKLLSATRNNVQTNYGQRQRLINALAEIEPSLPYQIAGQGMNALLPRGLVARLAAMSSAPVNALALPVFSPRLVGEAAYYAGRGTGIAERGANALRITERNIRRTGRGAYQAGRQQEAR